MFRKALFALALLGAAIASQAQDVKVEKFRLPNGLTVILHRDSTVPMATINTWFYVGSKDEQEKRSGFAHLFEHLMFMGTERVPGSQFDQLMEEYGGWNNASTTEDKTNYISYGPSNMLNLLLWLDADRLEDLGRLMDQKKLDLQREVVRNERRQNVELQPYGEAYERLPSMLFPKGHPYHTSVIGSHEDLQNATVKDVQDFFDTFYVPNNASLVVAGDIDPIAVKAYITSVFGTLPRKNDPPRKDVPITKINGVRKATLVDSVPDVKTIMAWHSPAAYQAGDIEMSLASSILSSGVSSRLYQELVVKREIASEVSAWQNSLQLGSYFVVEANAVEGVSIETVEKAIDEILSEFGKTGPTAEELKRQAAASETAILSNLQSISSKADKLNEYQFYWGEPNSFKRDLQRIRAVTPQRMASVVSKTLDLNSRVILRVIPKSPPANRALRDTKPAVEAEKMFTVPAPAEFRLSNGIAVQYFHRPDVPLMNLSVVVDYGSDYDPEAQAGKASLLAEMLTSGTGTLDANGFETQLDLLGASVNTEVTPTKTHIKLQTSSANFEEALKLFAGAVIKPSFLDKEWQSVQRIHLTNIIGDLEDPMKTAGRVAAREFFGQGHPASAPASGNRETVQNLNLATLKSTHANFGSANMTLFAAGSLPSETVKAALERAFGPVSAGKPFAKPQYDRKEHDTLKVFIVDFPETSQTVITFRMPGPEYSNTNRLGFSAIGTILGGTFTSRLNSNLREDKGYTYGAGAKFEFRKEFGVLSASSAVRADVTGASLKEFLAEFENMRVGGITEAEANKAKATLKSDIVGSFSSLSGLISVAIEEANYGKKVTALQQELTNIGGLSDGILNQMVKGAIPVEKGIVVLVGDKKLILEQIKDLGLPEPVVVNP